MWDCAITALGPKQKAIACLHHLISHATPVLFKVRARQYMSPITGDHHRLSFAEWGRRARPHATSLGFERGPHQGGGAVVAQRSSLSQVKSKHVEKSCRNIRSPISYVLWVVFTLCTGGAVKRVLFSSLSACVMKITEKLLHASLLHFTTGLIYKLQLEITSFWNLKWQNWVAAQQTHLSPPPVHPACFFHSDYKGWTCLHHTAHAGYTQTMDILLSANPKLLDKTDEEGVQITVN